MRVHVLRLFHPGNGAGLTWHSSYLSSRRSHTAPADRCIPVSPRWFVNPVPDRRSWRFRFRKTPSTKRRNHGAAFRSSCVPESCPNIVYFHILIRTSVVHGMVPVSVFPYPIWAYHTIHSAIAFATRLRLAERANLLSYTTACPLGVY